MGVFPLDRLPKINTLPASLIINTDPHNEPGEHWVAVYVNKNRIGIYFDSYGLQPLNKEINNFLNIYCKCWTYNSTVIQGVTSVNCGQYCVLFVLLKSIGHSLFDIIKLFTKRFDINDKLVEKIYKIL